MFDVAKVICFFDSRNRWNYFFSNFLLKISVVVVSNRLFIFSTATQLSQIAVNSLQCTSVLSIPYGTTILSILSLSANPISISLSVTVIAICWIGMSVANLFPSIASAFKGKYAIPFEPSYCKLNASTEDFGCYYWIDNQR